MTTVRTTAGINKREDAGMICGTDPFGRMWKPKNRTATNRAWNNTKSRQC